MRINDNTLIDIRYQLEAVIECLSVIEMSHSETRLEVLDKLMGEMFGRIWSAYYQVSYSHAINRPENYNEVVSASRLYDEHTESEVVQ